MMKKTSIASAISLALGVVTTTHALTISITQMDWGNLYAVSGTVNDAGTGNFNSVDPFFFQQWFGTQMAWFDTHSSTLTWSGNGYLGTYSAFEYTFHLTGNQVAVGFAWDWQTATFLPVLTIFECNTGGSPNNCTGQSLPMAVGSFFGQQPGFSGVTTTDFPVSGTVPVPPAVWLLGSGLLGLVGIIRRRKSQENSRFD